MERCEEMQEYYNAGSGLNGCWKWRAYEKLESGGRQARRSAIRLGGGRRRRLWSFKVSPRLKMLQAVSPKRLFARLSKAYVRAMLGFADKLWFSYGGGGEFGGMIRGPPEKDYCDDGVILKVQKLLLEEKSYRCAGDMD